MSGRLLGYPEALQRLQQELAQERISHAYLVVGPPQVGKRVLALDLAQALNCEGDNPPCGLCPHCLKTVSGTHPDVQVLGLQYDQKAERLRKEIGIDQVRALQHDAGLHPFWGKYRVFIVDEAQRLSSEAANCLLKTLEEPPAACIMVLLVTDERSLPSTVVSRCRKIYMYPLARGRVERALLEQGATEEEARLLSRLSRGRLGWALAAREDARQMESRASGLDALKKTLDGGLPERFKVAEGMAGLYYKDRDALDRSLQMWLGWWRDLLLVRGGHKEGIDNVDQEEGLGNWSGQLAMQDIVAFIRAILDTMDGLERNVNPRLALEALMLRIPAVLNGA